MHTNEPAWAGRVPDWLATHRPADGPSTNPNLLPLLRYEHRAAIQENSLPCAESCVLDFIAITVDLVPEFGCVAVTYERRSYRHRGKGEYWYWTMCRAQQIAQPPSEATGSPLGG